MLPVSVSFNPTLTDRSSIVESRSFSPLFEDSSSFVTGFAASGIPRSAALTSLTTVLSLSHTQFQRSLTPIYRILVLLSISRI